MDTLFDIALLVIVVSLQLQLNDVKKKLHEKDEKDEKK